MLSIPFLACLVVFSIGAIATFYFTPVIANMMMKRGIFGIDVHKLDKPKIPEMCGLAILIGIAMSSAAALYISPEFSTELLAFLSVVFLSGLIGYVDDRQLLGPRLKPLLTALAGFPILLLGIFDPYPVLPIIGRTRLTIVYPLLIPLAIAVPANAVNMMDPLNGVMAGAGSIVTTVLLISSVFLGRWNAALLSAGLLGCLLAFYYYNRFPSKVFSGNVGSLTVGAALGAIVIIGRLEAIGVIAMIPHIMNAFYGLASVGRLFERREITVRPIKILKDGRLAASSDPKTPITLTRTILADGPKKEKDVVNIFLLLTCFSSILSLLTLLLMVIP